MSESPLRRVPGSTVTPTLLRDTRGIVTWTVGLLSLWGFGNLYEFNATLGALIRGPEPGALPGPFEAGSPFYYYVPASPLALAGTIVLAVRTADGPPMVARRTRTAAVLTTAAAAMTAALVTTVNPRFRDHDARGLNRSAIVWLAGNTVRLACVSAACWNLLAWRRHEDQP